MRLNLTYIRVIPLAFGSLSLSLAAWKVILYRRTTQRHLPKLMYVLIRDQAIYYSMCVIFFLDLTSDRSEHTFHIHIYVGYALLL